MLWERGEYYPFPHGVIYSRKRCFWKLFKLRNWQKLGPQENQVMCSVECRIVTARDCRLALKNKVRWVERASWSKKGS